jgi:hypothetical protein
LSIKQYIKKSLTLSPHVTLLRVAGRISRLVSDTFMRRSDTKRCSYENDFPTGKLLSYFPKVSVEQLLPYAETIAGVTTHFLDHRFDLLGSGWVQVKHGMRCRGLERYRYDDMGGPIEADSEGKWLEGRINSANTEESKRIWELIFDDSSVMTAQGSKDRRYCPIDWHLDFKSGYRWQESTWYKDIRYGHKLGVDVKVPWELARMQHLPQLAFAYVLAGQNTPEKWHSGSGFAGQAKPKVLSQQDSKVVEAENQENGKAQLAAPEQYALEFRSQVLDFIANNPPRFGVNWKCTMDVGIRVANWLVSYDLFRAYGAKFDGEFDKVFMRSVYEHGLHIVNNLEWGESLRSNHYLSDIAGLLFVAAYLPRTPETDSWLAFAVQEMIKEVALQFYPDGGNFEGSTSYHRLSAEMVVYATAMVLGLPNEKLQALKDYDHTLIKVKPGLTPSPLPHYRVSEKSNPKAENRDPKSESFFPPWYFERLEKMAEFTMHITKPTGHIPQIGDNDSGRFFKFQPVYNKMTVAEAKKGYLNLEGYDDLPDDAIYWDEDFLDHRHLVAAINGLFDRDDFAEFSGGDFIETGVIGQLAGDVSLMPYRTPEPLAQGPMMAFRAKDGHAHYESEPDSPADAALQNGSRQASCDEKTTAAEKSRIEKNGQSDNEPAFLTHVPDAQKQVPTFPLPDGALEGLKLYGYPDFGLYIYRGKRLYLAIRCGSVGQNGNGGHAHNDQLSIELNIDGKDVITDPGTYLYTPLPARRNEYRSVKAHFAPQMNGREPVDLTLGLFELGHSATGECIYFGAEGFVGKHYGYGKEVWRKLQILRYELLIIDYHSAGASNIQGSLPDSQRLDQSTVNVSPSYGVRYI